jgi:hypothetical protein
MPPSSRSKCRLCNEQKTTSVSKKHIGFIFRVEKPSKQAEEELFDLEDGGTRFL